MASKEPSSRDLIDRLVAFDTTSRGSNLALIHFVRDYLADLGVESLIVPDEEGLKANLYATLGPEAGLFSEAGVPAVVCGPGSIDQAHKPNEFITGEQIALCEGFMDRLMERLGAG